MDEGPESFDIGPKVVGDYVSDFAGSLDLEKISDIISMANIKNGYEFIICENLSELGSPAPGR